MKTRAAGLAIATMATMATILTAPVSGSTTAGVCGAASVGFAAPVSLAAPSGARHLFGPSFAIAADDRLYVQAGANTLGSTVWHSDDAGQTFGELPFLPEVDLGVQGGPFYEGDVAVDDSGNAYYAGVWGDDSTFVYRWLESGEVAGIRHLVNAEPRERRPSVAAHGDGHVYVVGLSDALFLQRSSDHAASFDPLVQKFPDSTGWAGVATDPHSSSVYVVTAERLRNDIAMWASDDFGVTWNRHVIADLEYLAGTSPAVAVSPRDGDVYAAWADRDSLWIAVTQDGGATWAAHDVTPFAGRYAAPGITVNHDGYVGLVFYAQPDANGDAGALPFAGVWAPSLACTDAGGDGTCETPALAYAQLSPHATPPVQLYRSMDAAFFSDGRLLTGYIDPVSGDAHVVRQSTGPNLGGPQPCEVPA